MGTEERARVLLVDDDVAVGRVLEALLGQSGFFAKHVDSARRALEQLDAAAFDVVVSDLRMPELDGLGLLGEIAQRWPDIPVVMLTAYATVPTAVECMRAGAADFLTKPFDRDEIVFVLDKVLRASAPARERVPDLPSGAGALIGSSNAMAEVYGLVRQAAPTLSTVLVLGESGTGKELVARAIHEHSPRARRPFVKVHCAALPDNLLESELFGYEKGAFTGAATRKPGRVEIAEGGTLFLDEIGDITPAMQVKLLRVLQDREYERLGGTATLRGDVRFVAATHRDLDAMVRAGSFREDLFYRLNVVPIWLPPLRDRPGDVPRLSRHFCTEAARRNGRIDASLDDRAVELLAAQPWRGNVRELQNFVERLVVLSPGSRIGEGDVRRELARQPVPSTPSDGSTLDVRRDDAEREALMAALKRSSNNRSQAARLLGVSRRTLYNKLDKHGLL
jgi:two-component system, NtrC family, response regulator AtoC